MLNKLKFLENKKINKKNFYNILKPSITKNHYTNFGPVQLKLENYISNLIKLKKRKVLMLSSATSGIHLLSKFFEYKLKKKITWIICDFNFFSANNLHLSKSIILDSNKLGLIDENILTNYLKKNKKKNLGVIFANIFGQIKNWSIIRDICVKNNIPFFVDNATGLFRRPNNCKNDFEVISFHHTKPWGIGEGGCIIVPSHHYTILKNMTNFGSKNFKNLNSYSSNFKISDYSCALIYQRLGDVKKYSKTYQKTFKYIFNIIRKNNLELKLFIKDSSKILNSYTPYLCSKRIDNKRINKTKFITFKKYYKSLNNLKNSKSIYDRIICIPNNPELLKISQKRILEDLLFILKN